MASKLKMPNDNFIGVVVGDKVELNSAWRTYLAGIERDSGGTNLDALTIFVPVAVNGDIDFINFPIAFDVNSITTICDSGTCTVTGKIDGVALGGTANSVSTSEQTRAHTSANEVAAGNNFTLTVSANSSCLGMSITVEVELTA